MLLVWGTNFVYVVTNLGRQMACLQGEPVLGFSYRQYRSRPLAPILSQLYPAYLPSGNFQWPFSNIAFIPCTTCYITSSSNELRTCFNVDFGFLFAVNSHYIRMFRRKRMKLIAWQGVLVLYARNWMRIWYVCSEFVSRHRRCPNTSNFEPAT